MLIILLGNPNVGNQTLPHLTQDGVSCTHREFFTNDIFQNYCTFSQLINLGFLSDLLEF
jgi:hypothetical protein